MVLTYLELRNGSRSVAIVLHNLADKLVHLQAGHVIAWVLATNVIPEGKPTPELMKKLDEQDLESAPQKLSIEERQQLISHLLPVEVGILQVLMNMKGSYHFCSFWGNSLTVYERG